MTNEKNKLVKQQNNMGDVMLCPSLFLNNEDRTVFTLPLFSSFVLKANRGCLAKVVSTSTFCAQTCFSQNWIALSFCDIFFFPVAPFAVTTTKQETKRKIVGLLKMSLQLKYK